MGREEQRVEWSSSERDVFGAVEDYLESGADIKVDIEALTRLLEPEDEEVCLRYILEYSTRRSSNIFQFLNTGEKEDHLVASGRSWLEHQGERVVMQDRLHNEWPRGALKGLSECHRYSKARRLPEMKAVGY